ncbi:hypothetical protein [Radiobacillus sp. PE A8.2]|uniref:hypothetical protein n=1 Tax=Radiobacillus sp. PE A8.2 TaxID=3380349 RepID=UPI00388E98DC
MKKIICITILLSVALSFMGMTIIPSTSYACSCADPNPVEAEFKRATAVFSGEVVKITENPSSKQVLFKVTETWKGVSRSQVYITTGIGGGDCGYRFQQGNNYLVYAHPSSMYGGNNGLVTIHCDGTKQLSEAEEDLVILGEGELPDEIVNLEVEESKAVLWVGFAFLILAISIIFVWRRLRK